MATTLVAALGRCSRTERSIRISTIESRSSWLARWRITAQPQHQQGDTMSELRIWSRYSRRSLWRVFFGILLLAHSSAQLASAQAAGQLFAPNVARSLDVQLESIMKENNLPSVEVEILVPGKGRYSFVRGSADIAADMSRDGRQDPGCPLGGSAHGPANGALHRTAAVGSVSGLQFKGPGRKDRGDRRAVAQGANGISDRLR